MRLFSFRAFSYDVHFHSTSSLITPIFIPRLLLRRLFSFPALSYCTCFFISRILLIRFFSLCKYQHKLSQCLHGCLPPPPSLLWWAGHPRPLASRSRTLPVKSAVWGMKDVRLSPLRGSLFQYCIFLHY
jgi:hypothetical protein